MPGTTKETDMNLFETMERVVCRPEPFEQYASPQLWNDPHISKGMLEAHLNQTHDAASYREAFIDRGVDWMASFTGMCGKTRVCDFSCGPGLWTTRFSERGAIVTGVDLSERSLSHARDVAAEKNLSNRYILQDYLEFSTDDRFDLITMIHGDFSVLSPGQAKKLLGTFRTLLSEGGTAVVEVSSTAHLRQAKEQTRYDVLPSGYWSENRHHLFTSKFKYEEEQVVCDKYHVIDEERALEILVWMQCYSPESLEVLFEQNGLQITGCYSDVAGVPYSSDSPRFTVTATAT